MAKFKTKFNLGDEFQFEVRDYFDNSGNKQNRTVTAHIACIDIVHTVHTDPNTSIVYSLGYQHNSVWRLVGRFNGKRLSDLRTSGS